MNRYSPLTYERCHAVLTDAAETGVFDLSIEDFSAKCRHITSDILHNYAYMTRGALIDILASLLVSPEPEQSLSRFERFCAAAEGNISLGDPPPPFAVVMGAVFAASGALAVRFAAAPEVAVRLAALEHPLQPALDTDFYRVHIAACMESAGSIAERIRAVHVSHTTQLARICARNSNPATSIADITTELSALAEAVIGACLAIAADELGVNSESGMAHRLFVLGLGKFGGRELNVSSDVDLIYLCDRMEGWESFEDMTIHTRLAERLTQLLTEATALGYLYRVDTRLRADGASGPLVRTTADYLRYLEMRGQAWERQMLLKARPVAGSIEGGRRFLDAVEHFIFPASIARSPHREIVALKNQIESRLEATGSKKTHLKLMPGGIRDIEFITQCLQLLMGGMHREVRVTGTLPALECLHEVNALSDNEYTTLRDAYILYRRIENALMWPELLPAFHIPGTDKELTRLETILAHPGLRAAIDRNLAAVRAIYDGIFSSGGEESFEELAVRAALNPVGDEHVRRFLESLGFTDPDTGGRDLSRLIFGETDSPREVVMPPASEQFLPRYLKALSELPDPGGTLARFRLITDAYRARSTLFDIMNRNGKFFDLIMAITHASAFMTHMLTADPSLLDWLVESGELAKRLDRAAVARTLAGIDAESPDDLAFSRRCLQLKHRQKLRIGVRDITGIATAAETFGELTILAELIVKAVFQRACRLHRETYPGPETFTFTVIAAGKLGSGQMDFGSDLDLIFLFRPIPDIGDAVAVPEQAITLAQHMLTMLGGGGVYRVYEVDARLRPEGGNAPLAVSLDEYERYFERRASTWERLALVRAGALAGDNRLSAEAAAAIHRFVYRNQFTTDDIRAITAIRESMIQAAQGRAQGLINIKSGRGGIADIDFIAQTYACHWGHENPDLRYTRTPDILEALGRAGIIPRHEASTLRESFAFLMATEKAVRIGSGTSVNTLPADGMELARIARLMGFTNIRRFSRRLADVTTLVSERYTRLMAAILTSADASSAKTISRPQDSE